MKQKIYVRLDQLEILRKRKYNLYRATHALYLLPLACSFIGIQLDNTQGIMKTGFIFVIPILSALFIHVAVIGKIARNYLQEFKAQIVQTFVADQYPNARYFPQSSLEDYDIDSMNIYKDDYSVRGEDLFVLEHEVHNCKFSGMTFTVNTTDNSSQTAIRGLYFLLDFAPINSSTIKVISKQKTNSMLLQDFLDKPFIKVHTARINRFIQEQCTIYTTTADAVKIINPDFEKIIRILTEKWGSSFEFCFHRNKLLLGIQNPYGFFQVSINQPIDKEMLARRISDELQACFEIANPLIAFVEGLKNEVFESTSEEIDEDSLDDDDFYDHLVDF